MHPSHRSRFASKPIALALVVLLAAALAGPARATDDLGRTVPLRLQAGTFDPRVESLPLPPGLRLDDEPSRGHFVVQFAGAPDRSVLQALGADDVEPIAYLPDRAYLVRLAPGAADALRADPRVRWVGAVQPGWKISPELGVRPYDDPARRQDGKLYATVDLFPGESLDAVAARAVDYGAQEINRFAFHGNRRLMVRAARAALERLARLDAVAWIEEAPELTPRNDTAHWVTQTDVPGSTTIWDRGLHGEGQVIGHIDGAINMTSCYFADTTNNTPGPNHRKVIAYRGAQSSDSHGTHTAGTVAGDASPINGSLAGAGHAYAAKISHTRNSLVTGFGNGTSNLYQYLELAHQDGARVHTNSWGDDGTTVYTTWARDIDRFSYDYEDSLVLFAVSNQSTLRTPENAKNVLAVGASQNGTNDDLFCSGGAGPTNDGRRKPEIYAPGCGIQSASSSQTCGTQSSSGTSMACPAVTGNGALVRQYFEEGWYPSGTEQAADAYVPSGALVKAVLLNATVDMTGLGGYPGNQEGWGRLLLENALYFAGETRRLEVLADLRNAIGLATGGEIAYPLSVTGSGEPLKISLVFTEPAAAWMAASATVNDLDLEVTGPGGEVWLGNVFDLAAGRSTTGGAADPINNVETVLLPAPTTGNYLVKVKAAAVNQGLQGFSLVATGEVFSDAVGSVRYLSHQIDDSGPLANGNGVADPGETVQVPVALLNLRPDPATGVSAQLFSDVDGAAAVVDGSALFPDLAANTSGGTLPPHFTITVPPGASCGDELSFTIRSSHSEGVDETGFDVKLGRDDVQQAAAGLPVTLPKVSLTPTLSSVQIAESFPVAEVRAFVHVTHERIVELEVDLTSPEGTTVRLHDKTGGETDDINGTYGLNLPVDGPGALADFVGESSDGTWTLAVTDANPGFPPTQTPAGVLEAWTLILKAAPGTLCAPLDCGADAVPAEVAPDFTLAIDGGSDLRLTWPALAGADAYRVWRAADPRFATAELVGTSTTEELTVPGALADPSSWYYRVRAVNSCQWEGP